MNAHRSASRSATAVGVLAAVVSVLGALYLLFGARSQYTTVSSEGTVTTSAPVSGIDYLLSGAGGNAPVLLFWAMVLVLVALSVGYLVWTENHRWLWAFGIGLMGLSILGTWSIGWIVAPVALLVILAAFLLTTDLHRENGQRHSSSSPSDGHK